EIPPDVVIFGEVGLSGEVRSVANFDARIKEAEKLGFKKIICPRLPKSVTPPKTIEIKPVKSILELMKEVLGK
ncbi:MAG: DNA repair protein RadA, partial [Candidatus Peregrinibacteria bacterium]|nr:DNA repair protein RadA [Candidatus Peregrinibacteria bacterium]